MTAASRYLTEAEVSDFLGVSRATLARWRRANIGPLWSRLGPKRLAYPADALAEYLAAQTRQPIAA